MPVALFTGLPGAGKTATLVKRITELQEKEPGRPVFQYGINGLKEGLAITLTKEMLDKWWELPPGSIICLDECQEDGSFPGTLALMPKDNGRPADWVQRITKVRHYGMDFLLTTQHPANMSAYVRRLVDHHVHAVRRAKGVRQTFTWQRCMDDPDARTAKKTGQMSFDPLPKEVFDLYKSSSLHTMKVRTPRIVYFAIALAVAGVALAVIIPYRMHKLTQPSEAVQASVGSSSGSSSVSQSDALRNKDFAKWMTPRVPGVPWSAPMFDHLDVQASPRLFCIAADDGRCSCNTEQGTRYEVAVKQCRLIVANGMYNPFVSPVGGSGGAVDDGGTHSQPPASREAALPPGRQGVAGVYSEEGAVGPHKDRQTATAYTPPEYHAWNSDPFGSGGSKSP
ncbi:zonular occludens toxin domain-containing protein [Dyella humicola]|uniref:zonular occludens toxin domain-containing protein n=1 Tax=Dyella humicola TaxID=2992126 RepID=UPI00225565E6|nr:zonular occludens toxin domain-containing protein [Dyella humicola]